MRSSRRKHRCNCPDTPRAGVARNEETLQPTVYLNKLPDTFQPDTRVLVTDPMLATGAVAALGSRACSCVRQLMFSVQEGRCAPALMRSLPAESPSATFAWWAWWRRRPR